MQSPEISRSVGGYLKQKFDDFLTVDVHNPEEVVNIEVREQVYIYTKSLKGQGACHIKQQGRVCYSYLVV